MLNRNKNFGFSKANSEWILSLDADERVSPELTEEIKSITQKGSENIVGYWIPRKNIIFGKWMQHTGWYPDLQLRLFKKGSGKFEEVHVHEMISVSGDTEKLNNHIVHYNYDTISQFIYKHTEIYAPNEAETLLLKGYIFSPTDAINFPLKEFISRFFLREGYKDGFHGLVLSLLLSFYHLIIFTKIWEKRNFEEIKNINVLDDFSKEVKQNYKELSYWIANEKIKETKNIIKKIHLRVQRKING